MPDLIVRRSESRTKSGIALLKRYRHYSSANTNPMRTTIASTLILIAVCLAIFAAKPANLDRKARSVVAQRRDSLPTLAYPRSPIRYLILVVGESRSFDSVFGTYVPSSTQMIWHLLSN